jgi:hypothetical protein
MPPTYNEVTGLKRRAPRRYLPRKKRYSQSSTVASRMYAAQAMKDFQGFISIGELQLFYLGLVFHIPNFHTNIQAQTFARVLLIGAYGSLWSAIQMLMLDSQLLDLDEDHEDDSGFHMPLEDITLDSFSNDDECEAKTRFTKDAITTIVNAFINAANVPDEVYLYYALPSLRYYKFKVESLVIYMLRKMSTARTHCDLCQTEFGGADRRWGYGYNWIVKKFDTAFARWIGPQGLGVWATKFPEFAEHIRKYVQRDKERTDRHGNQVILGMPLQRFGPGEFNVFSVVDCTVYEVCRPGSGPANNNNGAGRRQGWYIKQVSRLCLLVFSFHFYLLVLSFM